jgi:hypothetical protein
MNLNPLLKISNKKNMKINFYRFFSIAIIMILSGCATTEHGARNLSDIGRYTTLQKGVTTKRDVYISFGQPHNVQYMQENTSLWRYFQSKTSSSAATFIPFVGLIAGGVDSQTLTTSINFDENNLYQSVTTDNTKKTTNMWALAGQTTDATAKIELVKNEMKFLKLPFDENLAKKMIEIEIFSKN